MTKFLQQFVLTLLIGCVYTSLQAQQVKFNMGDLNENFYTTQKKLNKYFKNHEKELARERKAQTQGKTKIEKTEEQELGGYELFKRWEYFMEPRVYPSGDKTLASRAYEEYKSYLLQNSQQRQQNPTILSSTWQPLGPFGDPTGGNAGRINAVRFDPVNVNGVWICTPDGGLWSTTSNGSSWTTNTDQLSPIGNADVCFDPTNALNMYMATGDGDANDSYSIGVLKSIDGGGTWSATGLAWTTSQGRRIYKMLINPLNKNVIFVASNIGVYRTTNGGTSWASVSTGAYTDIEYRPGDTTTVYAVSTSLWGGTTTFYKSINGGSSFSAAATGLPASANCDRFAIAVTAANNAFVYLVASNAANDGFYGCYQSINNGASFSAKSNAPNLLGWASAGTDVGGQGWYTLSIAASPTNANEIIVGGVNTWKSINGGAAWTLSTHWTGTGAPYMHADCHDLIYKNGTTVYAGTDGGIFFTANSGASWAAINGNMNISEMYKMGNSKTTYSLAIAGHQDNGTNLYTGGWSEVLGGDGMSPFIDWSNDNVMYGEQYQGSFNRSLNGGATWAPITTGITGAGAWNTPWHQDPITANTLYGGRQQMFVSTNQGTNWSAMAAFPTGTASITEFAVASSNSQVIYAIQGGTTLFKTTDGGASWTNVTAGLPVGSAKMTCVAVKNVDPNSVWVTFSGYSIGNKVYQSTDGGISWTNYSTGLPNLPTNCITYWNNTKNGLYIGCDVGIYYRDSLMASWVAYNTGLPNVSVHDLAIFYPLGKIRAATYGRGMWEADLYNSGLMIPIANFTADKTFICAGMTVNFTDQSTFGPTSWSWTFQGGVPATSTVQNPSIVYNTAGTYSVSLTATNINGSNTMTKTMYITVSPVNTLPLVEGFQGAIFPPANWQNYDAGNDNLKWAKSTTVGKASTASMVYDNYNLNSAGKRDEMRAPKYNFSGFATVKLYFDVAYAQYDATYSDTLAIMVSSDCGLTYNQVYVKGGTTLATAPNYTVATFTPTAAQWRTDTVYLNAYVGMTNVMVSFQNRGRYGQALYIDNINIAGSGSGLPPVASFTNSAVMCTGQNILFTDASTNAPTSWNWAFSGGAPPTSTVQNPSVSFTTPGTHTVTLIATNSFGSSAPFTQTITVTATPTITATPAPATICSGQIALLSATGATTYTWSANAGSATTSTVSVSPIATTVYTVTGANGSCISTGTVTVTVNPTPTVTATNASICSGNSATLTASGATTYLWSTSAATNTISVSPASTTVYTVTGTSGGCSAVKTSTVTVTPNPTVTVNSATICAGATATLTASGATTYSWNTGASTASINVTPASNTVYTVTGTTAGCTGTNTSTVTVSPNPTVTVNAATICSGATATLTASGAATYSWNTGASSSSINVTPGTTSVYTVSGTTGGCTNAVTTTVTVNPTPTVNVNSSTICFGSPTTLTAGGATTYSWSPGTGLSATTGSSVTANPPSTTVYTITGTTGSCNGSGTATVTVVSSLTVTVNSAAICAGSTATLTASGASTYSWSTGGTSASINVTPASTTVYTVTGTSGSCNAVNTSTVTVSSNPTVTVNAATICSGASAMLTANGANTYLWSTSATTNTISVGPASTTVYTVTGTTGGCTNAVTTTVTVNATPTITVNSAAICAGATATLTASGASTYSWSTGGTSTSINVTPASTTVYTVTGTTSGCTGANTSTVTVSSNPTITVNTATICAGATATLTASGASSYSWSTGGTSASINVTPASTTVYTVTGTTGSCNASNTSTVTVNALPNITATAVSNTICIGNSTNISASGAVTYTWSPAAGLNSTTGATVVCNATVTTNYSISGTGANGCINTTSYLITVNGCTGSSQLPAGNEQLAVYPNPSNGTFVLEIPAGNTTVYTIEIRNALSQLIYADKIQVSGNAIQKTITIPEVKSGVYTFFIWNGENKLVRKIIIE